MSLKSELIESRVDWISASVMLKDCSSDAELIAAGKLAASLLTAEEQRGNRLQRFSLHGFNGLRAGSAAVGKSASGMIFRLSGDVAAEQWKNVYELSTNVSRLDCAATLRHTGAWIDRSRVHLDEARSYAKKSAPKMRVTRIDGGAHGTTLNIGSRVSDAYGRIYDKEAESQSDHYRDCWRYEVEFKRDKANLACSALSGSSLDSLAPASVSLSWFEARGIVPGQSLTGVALPRSFQAPGELDNSLLWFRTGVRGSVARVIAGGRLKEALDSLGLYAEVLASAGYVLNTDTKENI